MRLLVLLLCTVAAAVAVPIAVQRSADLPLRASVQPVLRDVNPERDFPAAFASALKPAFLAYMNAQNITGSDNQTLNFVDAEVLGFPANPLPATGDVTRDMLSQSGGLKYVEGEPIKFAAKALTMVPVLVSPTLWTNDGSVSQSHSVSYSESFTSSQTLTCSGGTEAGVALAFEVDIPFVAKGKLEPSISANLESGKSTTESETSTWELTQQFTVPPHSIVNATCFIATGEVNTTWSGTLEVDPSVAVGWVYYDDRVRTKESGQFWVEQADLSYAGLLRWRKLLKLDVVAFGFQIPISGTYGATSAQHVQCSSNQCKYKPDVKCCGPSAALNEDFE